MLSTTLRTGSSLAQRSWGLSRLPTSSLQRRNSTVVTISFNFNNAVDKAHETKSLKELIDSPPSALQGLTLKADESLSYMKIKTIKDLGSFKYYKIAKAIKELASTEEAGKRSAVAKSNINKAVKVAYEALSLAEILASPVSALQGIKAEKAAAALEPLGIKTVADLAGWKYAARAEALLMLSKTENEDGSSK